MQLNVALLGFGSVGRALARLLVEKQEALREEHDIQVRVVGISTNRHGHAIDRLGINLQTALDAVEHQSSLGALHQGLSITETMRFLADVPANLVFESIPTNPYDGTPALAYDFGLLERGIHVVTANKGPVVFAQRELMALAARKGVGFFYESTVMDGAPVLSTAREALPVAQVHRIRGIFNSTTNYVLTRMEQDGMTFDQALAAAQEIGIAETDPTLDIEGWDAAIKTAILGNVVMGGDLRPSDVDRQGINGVTLADVQAAEADGSRIRLLCEAELQADGTVSARVAPERVPIDGSLAGITGTSSIVEFETDTLPRLALIENDPGPRTTAYGMLVDMISVARGRHRAIHAEQLARSQTELSS